MIINNYDRQLLAMNDTQLEQFVREWVGLKTEYYVEVTRFSGAGDLGRDVVGFLSKKRHEGSWHNYQCKQYAQNLPTDKAVCEIGKILYYSHNGEFTAPDKYFFVAPRGVNRNLERLIFNPQKFKTTLINEWDKFCSKAISNGITITLDASLKAFIDAFDFSKIERISLDDILLDKHIKPVLFKWFGADPGPAPLGQVPAEVQKSELPYIKQLLDAYSERSGQSFVDHKEIENHPELGDHLSCQRERFYDADAFKRFYRDNTDPLVLETFEKDIRHGVIDTLNAKHSDALTRVDAVMTQAATVQASGPLAQYARVPVKQGVCHHFANEGRFKWRR
jgi:hypothetical protein